ncbi:Aldose 1-epimerase [Alkaliphilus metalliredigens QYMF]|uniref:Aldose 1-epimerase n=1 Tax=Alkaliphilus metalliredigens (strain QYMF) TaxID=293826 RepID=A6TUQ1_ALKMQ|nr:aldose epimerase family protein [Alkaliphilus metalliredigens]ABR49919.1 Aldose 1-epimerase [Alkaliphilus metalliredigens QYMF]
MDILIEKCNEALDGNTLVIYTLTNEAGMKVKICNLGATIISLFAPDRKGKYQDIVLGFEKIENYYNNTQFLGAIIGRYANRIEGGVIEIGGIEYKLERNDGNNHLHGGYRGFDKVFWSDEAVSKGEKSLVLSYTSEDMEENYPGKLEVKVSYSLTSDNALRIDYYGISNKDTIVNLTNHSYFNLSGHDKGDIGGHELIIDAEYFTPINQECLPTGEIRSVEGTAMDFRNMKIIATGLESDEEQIIMGQGYDHNFVLRSNGDLKKKAAEVHDPVSGRRMEVYTTKPGIQFYSGNHLESSATGKNGVSYKKWSGLCLETQYFPNGMKHKHFPSCILKKGKEYKHTTIYKFL